MPTITHERWHAEPGNNNMYTVRDSAGILLASVYGKDAAKNARKMSGTPELIDFLIVVEQSNMDPDDLASMATALLNKLTA